MRISPLPLSPKKALLFLAFCLLLSLPGGAGDCYALDIYPDVYNHQEEYVVQKGDRLPTLAQRRSLRLQVLTKQNHLKNPGAIKPGMTLNLSHAFILPTELTDGLVVNLAELTVYHFQNGAFVRRYPLAAGRRDWETPTGNYKILNKIKNPTWRVPESIQEEMWERGQEVITEVPPGPKNPLGAFWMATSAQGVGFHATTAPWSVGRFASHGCFRMLKDHIEELFNSIEVGTPVKIIYKPIKLAVTPDNRIFLEVHGDYYGRVPNFLQAVQNLAKNQLLTDRIDWSLVKQAIKVRDGVALEITRAPETTTVEAPVSKPAPPSRPSGGSRPAEPAAILPSLANPLYSGEIVNKPPDAVPPPNPQPAPNKKPKEGS